MRKRTNPIYSVVMSAVLTWALLHPTDGKADETAPPASAPCVKWTLEARFVGVAYNHLVELTNNCDYVVSCRVKTDVNPSEETVVLKPKENKTHLTFRGSPASVFKAEVSCKKK